MYTNYDCNAYNYKFNAGLDNHKNVKLGICIIKFSVYSVIDGSLSVFIKKIK